MTGFERDEKAGWNEKPELYKTKGGGWSCLILPMGNTEICTDGNCGSPSTRGYEELKEFFFLFQNSNCPPIQA
jgi:hypothetical protein